MANLNIKFNNKSYSIDPASLADATARLEAHLMGMMEERLEGDGAEYYTLAPTALSFRSTAPLNELQEVQINGVTVDPSNYTLEEGSTIVTFPIDYLKTLNVGNYEVAVASESKTVKGDFSVKAPELNEHSFYYNQPYSAKVILPGFSGEWTVAFFIREDGTFDSIAIGGTTETGTYEINGNEIIAVSQLFGQLNCVISSDGTEIFCNELQTAFKLSNDTSIAADEDYIYIYKEDLGGYEVTAIDKTKAEYGAIKTGINGIDTVKLADYAFTHRYDDSDGNHLIGEHIMNDFPKMPNGIKNIGVRAFDNCQFESAELPNGITSISEQAFIDCRRLISITFEGTTSQWNAITKGTNWSFRVPATHVHCIDGDVAL